MAVNQILPFCATDTGTNLLGQGAYDLDSQRAIGNQPGVARSQLVNKVLRQAAYVSAEMAQHIANVANSDVLDDANGPRLLAQIQATFSRIAPIYTKYATGGATGTHGITMYFYIATGSATAGATYTHNAFVYTVKTTVSGASIIAMTGTGLPLSEGTLTKSSGTGDAALTFYANRIPLSVAVRAVGGGGGGGAGSQGGSTNGGNGGNTTFGTSLITANGGSGGIQGAAGSPAGGAGGTATVASPATTVIAIPGQSGGASLNTRAATIDYWGAVGGNSAFFAGAGVPGVIGGPGGSASPNSGSGGCGGNVVNASGQSPGSGGGAGGSADALIIGASVAAAYAYAVGSGGAAGTGTYNGGGGADGVIEVVEHFQ